MPNDDQKPAVKERSDDGKEGNPVQPEAEPGAERLDEFTASLPELRKASEDLKTRIADARRHNDMPIDSALGSPSWEEAAADGRFDVPDDEDDK
jgi:hypothetical protein